ncbi:MAG: hypothetical protein OEU50_05885 [Gammaproteobacteria bacterium]|nr:hypothetical protein [Gammaproteobacteria bacterium]
MWPLSAVFPEASKVRFGSDTASDTATKSFYFWFSKNIGDQGIEARTTSEIRGFEAAAHGVLTQREMDQPNSLYFSA